MSAKLGTFIIIITVSLLIIGCIIAVVYGSGSIMELIDSGQKTTSYLSSQNISEPLSSLIDSSSSAPSTNSDIGPNAAGKVVTAFLSPYIANTSYKNIYLNNRTDTKLDLKGIYSTPPKLRLNKTDEPEVLILHTHATEGYMTESKAEYTAKEVGETKDFSRSVINSGNIIAQALNSYGIKTLHDKTLHDDPSYTKSYSRSAETVKKYMEKYPSVKVVIDIHRDSVSTEGGQIRGVSEQNGKDAAQIMFVTGSQTGNVTDHPNWQENLRLVLRLQEISENLYPGLARSIYFTSKKYNQQLCSGALLIEVGSAVNTVEEAEYAAELLGRILGVGFGMYVQE